MVQNIKSRSKMRKLSKNDLAVWAIAVLAMFPALLVFNESEHIWVNLIGIAYIGVLALVARTNIGKMFFKRLEEMQDKLFGKIGG